jgi:hypothetical protein
MTKELTAEIKSEIQSVIMQVEDVLENTETPDISHVMANISRYDCKCVTLILIDLYINNLI